MRRCTRADDDVVVSALTGMVAGEAMYQIANRTGFTVPYVSVLRQRVLAHDLKHSGEPARAVKRAYFPRTGRAG